MNMQELLQKRAKAIKAQEEIMSKAASGLTAEMEKNFNDLQQEINESRGLGDVYKRQILTRSRMGLKITAALKVWVKCCTLLNMAIKKAAWKILKHKILLMAQAVVI